MTKKQKSLLAFSLIELSVVILIIGILVIGITKGSRIISESKISSAKSLTTSSPVASTEGLILWLDTSLDKSFDEAERTDGSLVSKWYDINPTSTTKNDAIQNSGALKPTYKKNGLNDLPTLSFDGTDCMVSPLNIDYTSIPNITMFVVYKVITAADTQALFGHDNGIWDRHILVGTGDYPAGVSTGGGINAVPQIGRLNKPQILTYIARNGVASGSSVSVNRSFVNSTFTESHANSGATSLTFGAIEDVNCDARANVYISESIVFNRALKTSERNAIEDYLSTKWNIKLGS